LFCPQLACPFVGSCSRHATSNVAQYAIDNNKVFASFSEVSFKKVQSSLQKTITWTKKSKKGEHDWKKKLYCCRTTCQDVENSNEDMICFSNDPIPKNIKVLKCYLNLLWMATSYIHLASRVPIFQTWAIVQTITNTFLFVVKLCVLNQNASYWLLSNAFYFAFTLCIAMKANVVRIQALNQLRFVGTLIQNCRSSS